MSLINDHSYDSILKIRLLSKFAELPTKVNEGSLFDFYSPETVSLKGGRSTKIPLDLQVQIPANMILNLSIKSNLARNSIIILNPIVDRTFRGNLSISLFNLSNRPYRILAQDKICQGSFLQINNPGILLSEKLYLHEKGDDEDEQQSYSDGHANEGVAEGHGNSAISQVNSDI